MKTITLTQSDKPLPAIFVGEDEASSPSQQVTIPHSTKANPRHPRNIQVSNEFIFVKRFGSPTVGMHVDDFIALCARVEPSLSWPPIFLKNVVTNGNPAIVESQFEQSNPELDEAGNTITYQWQQLTGSVWANIDEGDIFSGTKTNRVSINNVAGALTKSLRCVATNAAGSRASLIITSAAPVPTPAKA